MRQRHEDRKSQLPRWYDGMTATELRGVVIGKLIDAVRPLKTRFKVGWGYTDENRFYIHLEEKK